MTNLFSSFDPSGSILSISWSILFLFLLIVAPTAWKPHNPFEHVKSSTTNIFNNESNFSLGNTENGSQLLLITLFTLIILINFLALYPHIFSTTSHLTITLPLSLVTWLSIVTFGWLNNTNHILSHLLPEGTPAPLINFIVIIELVSSLIRPITLCVRLTANLIAGHLLITLLGSALLSLPLSPLILGVFAGSLLSLLESAVACIQAYVFITLITLYLTEVN